MGISTYIAARYYKHTVSHAGLRTIIIGHEKRASTNLFQLVKRFHEHLPDDLRPSTGTANAEELVFDKLDSGYLVSVGFERECANCGFFFSDTPLDKVPFKLRS